MAHARFYPPELRENFPRCSLRRCTISEIINAVLDAGFLLRRFDGASRLDGFPAAGRIRPPGGQSIGNRRLGAAPTALLPPSGFQLKRFRRRSPALVQRGWIHPVSPFSKGGAFRWADERRADSGAVIH